LLCEDVQKRESRRRNQDSIAFAPRLVSSHRDFPVLSLSSFPCASRGRPATLRFVEMASAAQPLSLPARTMSEHVDHRKSDNHATLRTAVEWSLLALVASFALKSLVDLDSTATVVSLSLLSLPKIAGVIFLALLGMHMWLDAHAYWFDRTHALLFFILVLACLSTMCAARPATAGLTILRYAAFFALYTGLSSLATEPRSRERAILVLVTSCAVASIVAIATLWSRHTLVATTPYGDPNDIAFILVSTLPLAVWLAGAERAQRFIGAAMAALIALATLLTFSRGALLALIAGIVWLVLVERRYTRLIAACTIVVLLVAGLLVSTNYERLRDSYEAKRIVASANVANRLAAWQFAAELTIANPLLGIGPGNFGHYYERYWQAHPDAHQLRVVHNSYLEIASEIGIPALVAFLAFYLAVFRRTGEVLRRTAADATLLVALRVSMVIAAVAALFVSEQLAAPFWLLAGLASATCRNPRLRTSPA
jgi:hypothetical protein